MKSMETKLNYGLYVLAHQHLTAVSIIAVGILIRVILWKVIGSIVLGFGICTFLTYWIAILYFSRRRALDDLPSGITARVVERGEAFIRPARPQDAPVGARLMYYTSPSMMQGFFGSTERGAVTALRRLFPMPGHTASYASAFVVEDRGNVVALLTGLSRKDWDAARRADWIYTPISCLSVPLWRIPKMYLAFDAYEKAIPPVLDDEYFIEHLAVLPEKRGQGIGSWLMDFAESLARAKGCGRMVLDAEIESEGARRFYRRLGFVETEFSTSQHYCKQFGFPGTVRMVKSIAVQ